MKDSGKIEDKVVNVVELEPRTLKLYSILADKSQDLANMLMGAWITLNSSENNPDKLSQVAHSMRELMEKTPIKIPSVPIQQGTGNLKSDVQQLSNSWRNLKRESSGWSGEITEELSDMLEQLDVFFADFATKYQPRKEQSMALVKALDVAGGQIPDHILAARLMEWDNLHNFFLKVAHHGNVNITTADITEKVISLEEFLLNLFVPKPKQDLDDLDILIAEGESTATISDELLSKVVEKIHKTRVVNDYFFENINSTVWILPLNEKGFFKKPVPALRGEWGAQFPIWPESSYLVRIADKAEDEVLKIIEELPGIDNERIMDDIVHILLKINIKKAFKKVNLVKQFISSPEYLLLYRTVSDFVCKLAENGYDKLAMVLAKEMLDVKPNPKREESYLTSKLIAKYSDHDYEYIVRKIAPKLTQYSPSEAVSLFAGLLNDTIAIKHDYANFQGGSQKTVLNEKQDDLSNIWRPQIAVSQEYNHDIEDILVTALCDSVTVLMKNDSMDSENKLEKLKELDAYKYMIFRRVVEFGLRNYKSDPTFKPFYNLLSSDKRLKDVLNGEENGIGVVRVGYVDERPTNILADLSDDALAEKLQTYKSEPDWTFERYSITEELGALAKNDPTRFVPLVKDIATIKYEYLDQIIRAFEEVIDTMGESDIVKVLESLLA